MLGLLTVLAATAAPPFPGGFESHDPPRGYVCGRAPHPPAMDGTLADPAWSAAPWTEDFADIRGGTRPAPRFRTRAKLLWDDNCLYIGAEIEEPDVWATLTERDSVIFHDNDFEVFIDPDGDTHNYYEFEMNALNTVWDLLLVSAYRDGGPPVNGWDIHGLRTAVHVNGTLNDPSDRDVGWTLEIAMPWSALAECAGRPCPPRDGDQWRINFSRVEWHTVVEGARTVKVPNTPEDNWVWSPQGAVDMHRADRWGYVQFSAEPPGVARFRRDPAEAVRDDLFRIYYLQREYRLGHGRYAAKLSELRPGVRRSSLRLAATESGYEATARGPAADGKPTTWHIRDNGRIWSDAGFG